MGDVAIPATALAAAALGILVVVLASRVSVLRVRHKISLGDGDNRELARAIRSHANTIEFAPLFLVMLLAYELIIGPCLYAAVIAAVFVFGRLLYAWGMWRRALTRSRQLGAGLSYLGVVAMAVLLLLAVFVWT